MLNIICVTTFWWSYFFVKILNCEDVITILIENQIIETSWNPTTMDWYIEKGYKYTRCRDKLKVKVEDLHPGSSIKVDVICDYCGKIHKKEYRDYLKKISKFPTCACKDCNGKKQKDILSLKRPYYFNKFVESCEKSGYKVISEESDYKSAHNDLLIECNKHGVQKTTYANAMVGHFCTTCSKESMVQTLAEKNSFSEEKVIELVESKNNNKLLNPEEYINIKTNNLKIKCGSCGKVWTTSLASIKASSGYCPECGMKKCSDAIRKTPEEVKKIIESVNNNVLLNPEEYITIKHTNLKIKCGICGNIFQTSLTNYIYSNTNRCSVCSKKESIGEKIIREFLDLNNINYEQEKRFDDCKDKKLLPFDFFLQDLNTCIEFDGQHHFEPIYGDIKHFEDTQRHDKIKNEYCKNNQIKLIRIPYWESQNIEQILRKELHI